MKNERHFGTLINLQQAAVAAAEDEEMSRESRGSPPGWGNDPSE
jgi:hypothetical protein